MTPLMRRLGARASKFGLGHRFTYIMKIIRKIQTFSSFSVLVKIMDYKQFRDTGGKLIFILLFVTFNRNQILSFS